MGRGIVKWRPFASIPQQYAGVRNIIENQKKIPQPILDEEEHDRINYILVDVIENNKTAAVSYWINGRIETEIGMIIKIDLINRSIQFKDKFEYITNLKLKTLVNVTVV